MYEKMKVPLYPVSILEPELLYLLITLLSDKNFKQIYVCPESISFSLKA